MSGFATEDTLGPSEQLAYNSARAFATASWLGTMGDFDPALAYSGISAMARHPYAAAEFLPEIMAVPDVTEYLTGLYNDARVATVAGDAARHRATQAHQDSLGRANKMANRLGVSRDDVLGMSERDSEFDPKMIELRSRMYRRNYAD